MYIDSDGVRLYADIDGADGAAPVLFLHGIGACAQTWPTLSPAITAGRQIIRLDLRGHGRSGRAPGTYDVEHFADDALAALRAAGLNDTPAEHPTATLVGHSLGGVVAWRVAQRRPDLIAAVLLEDPPLLLGTAAEFEASTFRTTFARMRTGLRALRASQLSAPEITEQLAIMPASREPLTLLRDTLTPDALAAMGFAYRWLDLAVLDSVLGGAMMSGTDVLGPVMPPVHILAAATGSAFPPGHAARLAVTHPHVDVTRIPGSGHGIHEERLHRDTFAHHLSRFLHHHAPVAAV